MTRKTYNITLVIGIALGIATLIFAFLCEFGVAFVLMLLTYAYSGFFDDRWRECFYNGFDDK